LGRVYFYAYRFLDVGYYSRDGAVGVSHYFFKLFWLHLLGVALKYIFEGRFEDFFGKTCIGVILVFSFFESIF